MTAQEHATQRDAVRLAEGMESSHDRHNCPPVRKPVACIVCERQPGTRGAMCDGCREAWLEGRKS